MGKRIVIVLLMTLVWFYTRSGSGVSFTPNLVAQDLEAKVIASLLVISDEGPAPQVDPIKPEEKEKGSGDQNKGAIESEDLPEVDMVNTGEFSGRHPRVILFTNLKTCVPCRKVDKDIIDVLRNKNYKSLGWTVGETEDMSVEIVDYSKDPDKFNEYFKTVSVVNEDLSPVTPMFVRVGKNRAVDKIQIGQITLQEFLRFATVFEE